MAQKPIERFYRQKVRPALIAARGGEWKQVARVSIDRKAGRLTLDVSHMSERARKGFHRVIRAATVASGQMRCAFNGKEVVVSYT